MSEIFEEPDFLLNKLCVILSSHFGSINEVGYMLQTIPIADMQKKSHESNHFHPFVLADGNTKLGIPQQILPIMFKRLKKLLLSPLQFSYNPLQIEAFSRCMLLVNPCWYPNYSLRKSMLLKGKIDASAEFRLLDLAFCLPPTTKNSFVWYHRKWLSDHIYSRKANLLHDTNLSIHLEDEIIFAYKMANRIARNYYAWEFMYWNICKFISAEPESGKRIIQSHVERTIEFLSRNIADSGAFHHLAILINLDLTNHPNCYIDQPSLHLEAGLLKIHEIIEHYSGPRQSAINGLINIMSFLASRSDTFKWAIDIIRHEVDWAKMQLESLSDISDLSHSDYEKTIRNYIIRLKLKG